MTRCTFDSEDAFIADRFKTMDTFLNAGNTLKEALSAASRFELTIPQSDIECFMVIDRDNDRWSWSVESQKWQIDRNSNDYAMTLEELVDRYSPLTWKRIQ